jgi:hypothetical protein
MSEYFPFISSSAPSSISSPFSLNSLTNKCFSHFEVYHRNESLLDLNDSGNGDCLLDYPIIDVLIIPERANLVVLS